MKTIEDLPQNLRDWLYLWVGVIPKSSVVTQLLEMQKRIDELTVQNNELQGSVKALESMLKPDGYNSECGEYYESPEDYVDNCLDFKSKVGDQFYITPFVKLPEESYEITEIDDYSFKIKQVEQSKGAK